MAELQKDSEEFELHQVCWNYYKKYFEPQDNDEYWENLIADGNELIKKYKGRALIRGMVNAYVDDIVERSRSK